MKPITPVAPGWSLPVTTFAKDQPEYLQLPCYRDPEGVVTTRWRLTGRERFRILFGGSLWIQQMTFNKPLQPIKPTAHCPLMRGEDAR